MDMNVVLFFAKMIGIWAVGGVLFVPLSNFVNSYLGKPQRLSYMQGLVGGVVGGAVFAVFQSPQMPLLYRAMILGVVLVGSVVSRFYFKKNN